MENDVILDIQQITVTQGNIDFKQYEEIKERAIVLADHIGQIEVTDENVKESKRLLAAVNKRLKELEDKRIMIKKAMLQPYETFEGQVKEIVSIVKTADEIVRQQVRQLEEEERTQKTKEIETIFQKRIKHYVFDGLVKFQEFLHSKHLTKSVSIEAVEKEMVDFFERIASDIKVIETLDNSKQVLSAYIGLYDLGKAITLANDEKRRKEAVNASGVLSDSGAKQVYVFTVYDEKDFKLLKLFMDQNQIKFDMKEGY